MNKHSLLIVSAAVTAFVLTITAGVVALVSQPSAAATPSAVAEVQAAPAPLYDEQTLQALLDEHDAAYRQALQQASSRLQQANSELEQAYADRDRLASQLQTIQAKAAAAVPVQEQVQAQPPTPAPAAPAAPDPTYAISAQQAAAIALRSVPGSTLTTTPTLVSFQGVVAYEVLLDSGPVYVDANSGRILYNGGVQSALTNSAGEAKHREDDESREDQEGDD